MSLRLARQSIHWSSSPLIFKSPLLPWSNKYPKNHSLSLPLSQLTTMGKRSAIHSESNPKLPPEEPTSQPENPSSSSKIPLPPQKIRKLSPKNKKSQQPEPEPEPQPQVPNSEDTSITKPSDPTPSEAPNTLLPIISVNPLTIEGEIDLALNHLRSSDPLLTSLIDLHRRPSFESEPSPPFLSLTKSILYQQLAPNAAKAIYKRFVSLCGSESEVVPDNVLALDAAELRKIGISGRKATYLHDLANKYKDGVLSDSSILEMNDESLVTKLTLVKGIGVWSVHMYMIFSLHKPDVLPVGDLGVRKGVQRLYGLKELPLPLQMEEICEKWKPYRSVGSWYMWRLMEAKGDVDSA
ncbi:DNA-3-methyladenine glycosylase 1 [Quercus lobata]|nr:DNA-3-methyladenine glycosylase 1 [Quercus lobata]